jgi:hypothetical protein
MLKSLKRRRLYPRAGAASPPTQVLARPTSAMDGASIVVVMMPMMMMMMMMMMPPMVMPMVMPPMVMMVMMVMVIVLSQNHRLFPFVWRLLGLSPQDIGRIGDRI